MCKLDGNEKISIVPNMILKDIQLGNTYALIETIQGKKFLVT
jgi:hypothetical protein